MASDNNIRTMAVTTQELARMSSEDELLVSQSTEANTGVDGVQPSIADQQKVGFFRQDRAAQTEASEILELKQMTSVLQILLKESKDLKRELAIAKQMMRADYENKLQEKSLDMYVRINDHVAALEKAYAERVEVIRRSFRQQQANAISKIANDWKNHAGEKMQDELKKHSGQNVALAKEYKQLEQQVASQEGIIEMLKMQLEEQANAPRSEASTPSAVYEAEGLREEVTALKKKIDGLESALDSKDELTEELNRDLERVNKNLEKEQVHIKQLLKELEGSKASAMQEISSLKRQAEKQRLALERDVQDKMKKARDDMLTMAKQHAADAQKAEVEKLRLQAEREEQAREIQQKEQSSHLLAASSGEEISKLNRVEKHRRAEIARLKREIAKSTKLWEKKFTVLQRSMYALKDESYLRQTLQKQAAILHHATVMYASDQPAGIVSNAAFQPPPMSTPTRQKASGNPPLPGIGQINPTRDHKLDVMSAYTVSPPPGRDVDLFSVGESQIVEPNEDYEGDADGGYLPLPTPPPPRWSEDSRPPSSSQMVMMASG